MIAAAADVARDDRAIRALFARLAPAALDQLVAEVARLSERVDVLTAELDDARRSAMYAEDDADYWRRSFKDLEDQLSAAGGSLGMTQSGQFVALPCSPAPAAEPIPATQELPMRFHKLDATGAVLPRESTGHVAVLDTYPHPDGQYRIWAVEILDGGVDDDGDSVGLTHADALTTAAAYTLQGASDWRLPTVDEAFALADRTRINPAIDTEHFPDTPSAWFWTSSPSAGNPDYAWIVNFYGGNAGWHRRDSECLVRAVRSVSPSQYSSIGLVG